MAERKKRQPLFRAGPTLSRKHNVGVAVSFGFPVFVAGLAFLITAYVRGGSFFWVAGAALAALGGVLLTSSRTL